MQQRRLRPGDVLDDYCPRERRITDHAIVAMIDDDIKQTRCVSCDTEHEYKQAKVPAQRRKKGAAGLFGQVLDGYQPPSARPAPRAAPDAELPDADPPAPPAVPVPPPADPDPIPQAVSPAVQIADPPLVAGATDQQEVEEGPVRRSLIRAQLPRHEGQQVPTRTLPEFTIRQSKNGRGSRPGGGHRQGSGRRRASDQQAQGGPHRFGGQRKAGAGGHGERGHQSSPWSGNRFDRGPRGGRGRGGKKR
jgi:hypothetical protein